MLVCAAFSGGAGASDAGALLEAARRGDTAQVASLLERKVEVDAASADGEATTKDGLKIGNGSLRLRQDDPGPTRESPLRDPRLNPYAPRQP